MWEGPSGRGETGAIRTRVAREPWMADTREMVGTLYMGKTKGKIWGLFVLEKVIRRWMIQPLKVEGEMMTGQEIVERMRMTREI